MSSDSDSSTDFPPTCPKDLTGTYKPGLTSLIFPHFTHLSLPPTDLASLDHLCAFLSTLLHDRLPYELTSNIIHQSSLFTQLRLDVDPDFDISYTHRTIFSHTKVWALAVKIRKGFFPSAGVRFQLVVGREEVELPVKEFGDGRLVKEWVWWFRRGETETERWLDGLRWWEGMFVVAKWRGAMGSCKAQLAVYAW